MAKTAVRTPGRALAGALLGASLLAAATPVTEGGAPAPASATVEVLVRELTPAASAAEDAVRGVGGVITATLPIVGGFAAEVPADRVDDLQGADGVASVEPSAPVTFDGAYGQGSGGPSAVYPTVVRADRAWEAGYRGQGVGVAVIDTGVNPVGDLAGRVSHSADFTAEGDGVDRFGHGTFVAGMIAGTGATDAGVTGTAPAAHIVSLKIAGADGSADITHVLAALQYAVSFKDALDIDVINLSLGTDSTQDYRLGLLNFAVERAWANGIVVVVSASNRGPDAQTISKPADDPFVITVGAADDRTTPGLGDDSVPAFSGTGPTAANGLAKPDLVAPGKSVVSTRAPGSTVDVDNPGARIGDHHFVGSGTSFASGVVSGAAALVLSRNADLTPDQVKARLLDTARTGPVTDPHRAGAGWLDAEAATLSDSTRAANEGLRWSEGTGSVQASRGSLEINIQTGTAIDPVLGPLPVLTLLTGDLTAQNELFDDEAYREGEWSGSSWYGSSWYGSSWYGSSWYGSSWYGSSWYGSSWYGSSWYGDGWQ
ncbi:MAG: S8 family serine peptidase [Actinomycetes bacterium]